MFFEAGSGNVLFMELFHFWERFLRIPPQKIIWKFLYFREIVNIIVI